MATTTPRIKSRFLSHGTLASKDLAATRSFYEEFLGIEVIRTSKISMMIRLGGNHTYAVVLSKNLPEMPRLNHNGIDVANDADVDDAYQTVQDEAEEWGISGITKPKAQHGTYSFHFWDLDGNAWEILSNPQDGYSWMFEHGDMEGKGHWDPEMRKAHMETTAAE